jgi:hypothetical protein
LYVRAKENEKVFRNILVNLSDDNIEAEYFKKSSIADIFSKDVGVARFETRISDFKIGSFSLEDNFTYVQNFPNFDPTKLKEDNAIVLIEKSNDSWLHAYTILENSEVKHEKILHHHQF